MMERNCYNCKYRQDISCYPFKKTDEWCKKQKAYIYKPRKECPKFKIKLKSRLFGDQSPYVRMEPLVGGCEED